jgi:multiple sugar transport system ATP-binding protein
MAQVQFIDVKKVYDGGVVAARDINLTIEDKELLVLVGPSGCGKSTVLRMVAGLEEASEGRILFDDLVVNHMSPKKRNVAMVFQSYALYPHMSVFDNLAFSLKLAKLPKTEIKKRVQETAEILGIDKLLKRKPKALSGGQRQRVALGRAIVRNPSVFLFDEPLSNLDAKMRVQMRTEIRKLNLRIQTTMLYVTHDQVEAMTLGDRLAVMNEGLILQVGTPLELYNHPSDRFVAAFIGSPAMNFVEGNVTGDASLQLKTPFTTIPLPGKFNNALSENASRKLTLGIRPENVFTLLPDDNGGERFHKVDGIVEVVEPLGNEIIFHINCGDQVLVARERSDKEGSPGDAIDVYLDLDSIHLFDAATNKALLAS